MNLRHIRRVAISAFLLGGLALAGYLLHLQHSGNFHTVVPDRVYRSNQPTPERLASYQKSKHIKAVLNLRGAHPGAGWYDDERNAAKKLGLTLIDFQMSDHRVLTPARVADLEQVMRDAPKPLLIHCKAGADRTGLASALYLEALAHQTRETAGWQLSILYGHIAIHWLSRAWPMDVTWRDTA